MTFSPSGDRIFVLAGEAEETSKSGLALPESAQKPWVYGTVVMVGPGRRTEAGDIVPMDYKVDDSVLFHRSVGQPVEIDDVEYRVLSPADIWGKQVVPAHTSVKPRKPTK